MQSHQKTMARKSLLWLKNNQLNYLYKYKPSVFDSPIWGEKLRYLFVGGFCAIADLLILYVLVDFFHFWYLASAIISFSFISLLGYFAQKYFTFKNNSKNHKKQLLIFIVIAVIGLLINTSFMFLFVSLMNIWYMLASIITKFIVIIWNYTANKKITFK